MNAPVLEIHDLRVGFPVYGGVLRHKVAEVLAVDGVSLTLQPGETLGLVGESGSGKTTVGRAVINLLRPTVPDVRLGGQILYRPRHGERVDLNGLSRKEMHPLRAEIQMIFQDPFSSLNPRMTVGQIVGRPLELHTDLDRPARKRKVEALLDRVGLQAAYAERYPHEFSGGQRQRIGIARALSTNPRIVVADEPVSALDVSVQAQVINLMAELQEEFGLTYLFIAHDIGVVYHVSDRIAVMYLGSIAEIGTAEQVYRSSRHPYSRALLSAIPQPNPHRTRAHRVVLQGDIPTPLARPSGCGFRTRCPIAVPECAVAPPPFVEVQPGHHAACPFTEALPS
ncbi:MAG: ABC transporter ATP-binding protein [Planctomycetota bacterium]